MLRHKRSGDAVYGYLKMSFKTSVKLDARIFNDAARRQALSSVLSKNAKEFKDATRRKMVESSPSGTLYEKRRGRGFTRSHRASRRGERPAPDTGTLANAVEDVRTGEFSRAVQIANRINPESGGDARDYAEKLQNRLDRPIMSDEDRRIAEIKLNYEVNRALQSLF